MEGNEYSARSSSSSGCEGICYLWRGINIRREAPARVDVRGIVIYAGEIIFGAKLQLEWM
jgi:hypothetical protein